MTVSYRLIFTGLVIAGIYYAAASLVTLDLDEWPTLTTSTTGAKS